MEGATPAITDNGAADGRTAVRGAREPRAKTGGRAKAKPEKLALLVVGMHRSGTSALTRTLSMLGCDLPNTLHPASPGDNDTGFWESQAVMHLNNEVLASAGSAWDGWAPFSPDWYDSPLSKAFQDRALAVLDSEFEDSRLFVLKDPRLCRLLRLWLEALEAFGAQPLIVSPIRHPQEVAASLKRRNDMDPSVAHLFWLRHVLDAEAASRHLRRSYVRYDDLLGGWARVTDKIAQDLGISWPRRSAAVAEGIEAFLSPGQRHHLEDDESLLRNTWVSHWIRTAFEILNRWTRGDVQSADYGELDRIRAALDEATLAFERPLNWGRQAAGRARDLERGLTRESEQAERLKADLSAERAARAKAEAAAEAAGELRSALKQKETALADAEQTARAESERTSRLEADLSAERAARAKAEAAAEAVGELRRVLEQKETALAEAEQTARAESERTSRLEADLSAERAARSKAEAAAELVPELRSAIAQKESALAQRQHETEQTALELAAARSELQLLTEAREQDKAVAASLKEQIELLLSELRERRTAYAALERELQAARAKTASEIETAAELRAKLSQSESELAQRQREVEETGIELAAARRELRHVESAHEQSEALAASLQQQVGQLNAAVETLKADKSSMEQSSKTETNRLEARLNERFSEIATLTSLCQKSEAMRADFAGSITALLASADLPNVPVVSKTALWKRLSLRRKVAVLRRTGLFDAEWYLQRYRDVADARQDAASHFVTHGIREGRAPSARFDAQ